MSLQLPATINNLILNNVTVPSGYVNYFLLAHSQMANSGESLEEFLVRQVVYQSVQRYSQFTVEQDYNKTVASGETIQESHSQFVVDIFDEEKSILDNY